MARIIETPRLVLRPHTRADLDESAAMWGDPETTRFIGGKPYTREEAWARLLRYAGHWDLLGFGHWVARDAAGRFVGEVGFADFQREIEPRLDAPEAGWVLARWAQGQGIKVVPSINVYHYYDAATMAGKSRDELAALILPRARQHIEQLKALGVTEFQVDSEFDRWFQGGLR
jgi:hypothetical protein